MKLRIEIDLENEAFSGRHRETVRILAELVRSLPTYIHVGQDWPLRDLNGNRVGTAEVIES